MKKEQQGEIKDLYQKITDRIIESLEKDGERPWFKPWSGGNMAGNVTAPLRVTGEPYKGINVINLWMTAAAEGYQSAHWMTFKQALELGGNVKKGEKGTLVVYSSSFKKTETDEKTGEDKEKDIPFLKGYTVFNADQCEGLPAKFYAKPEPLPTTTAQRIEHAEQFFDATGAKVKHGGNRAFFSPGADYIQLPPFEAFKDAESYTATKAHEFIHWTGHDSRLKRDIKNRFGTEDYAKEELVAELGSAFICADLAITPEVQENHAPYIASWLKALKDDKRLIFKAAAQAQKAADHLHSYQVKPDSSLTSEASAGTEAAPPCALDDPRYRAQVQALKDVTAALNGEQSSPVRFSTDPVDVPNEQQAAALQRFANEKGKGWKSALGALWASGKDERHPDGALLRQVRNQFGPEWLNSKANTTTPQPDNATKKPQPSSEPDWFAASVKQAEAEAKKAPQAPAPSRGGLSL